MTLGSMGSLALVTGDDCLEAGTVCEMAEQIRARALAKISEALCCAQPFIPIEVDGEKIDFHGYLRTLQAIVEWTYKVCREDAAFDPEVVISSPYELCRVAELPSCYRCRP